MLLAERQASERRLVAGRPRLDWIDQAARQWARERRRLYGLDPFLTSREILGPMRSTLGQRRDLHAGARSNLVEQRWPEVYTGIALEVHRAYRGSPPAIKTILDAHYCARGTVNVKAQFLGLKRKDYGFLVGRARAILEAELMK
jgi:hypothetical protein